MNRGSIVRGTWAVSHPETLVIADRVLYGQPMAYFRNGHAPSNLRDAFGDVVELGLAEVEFRGRVISARDLCGLLWTCADPFPRAIGDGLNAPRALTYGVAAQLLRFRLAGDERA